MGRHLTEVTFRILLPLLTVADIVYSAAGGDLVNVMVTAGFLSGATLVAGALLASYRYDMYQRMLPTIAGVLLIFCANISVLLMDWPLRLSYAVSRNSLDAVAERVRRGEQITAPVQAGLFTIRHAEVSRHRIVCLWTGLYPSGNSGFVQCASDRAPLNLFSLVSLDDRWQFVSED